MSRRPLVVVIGLTVGDYFLWNWSLNSNHAVIALISGLTFPPLALLLLWMLAVGAATLLARTARRPAARRRAAGSRLAAGRSRPAPGASRVARSATGRPAPGRPAPTAAASAAAEGTERSSARKIAA